MLERLQTQAIPAIIGNYDDGTGFDRDGCGCACIDPDEKALGDPIVRVDQGPHERSEQGLAALARATDPVRR